MQHEYLPVGAKVGKIEKKKKKKKNQNQQNLKFLKFDFKPHNFRYNHFFHLRFGTIVTCNVSKKMVAKSDEATKYIKIMQKNSKNKSIFLNYRL